MAQIYGSMSPEERQAAEETSQQPDVHLMLATDAMGEGLNLQFCHLMINYELPWNPNRIEQRIGRLHRYGQTREVRVYNMQVTNTRECLILTRLLEKLKTIKRQLGGYAPIILGLTTRDVGISLNRLSDLIMNAIAEDTPPEVAAGKTERGCQRLQAEINRQADACLESLEKFPEAKQQLLQLSILDYQQRLLFGEDMDIAIRRA